MRVVFLVVCALAVEVIGAREIWARSSGLAVVSDSGADFDPQTAPGTAFYHSSAASSLDGQWGATAFAGVNASPGQFLQFNFFAPQTVVGVITQGRATYDHWTKRFEVHVADGEGNWVPVNPASNPSTTSFVGNSDRTTKVSNHFRTPVVTTALRVVTVDCNRRCALRADVLVLVPAPSTQVPSTQVPSTQVPSTQVPSTQVHDMTAPPAVSQPGGHWKLAAIPVVQTVVALIFGWWAFHTKDAHNQPLADKHPTMICFLVFTVFASLLVPFHPHLADAIVGSIVPKFPW
jgi:hypothetical protein